MWVRKQGRDEKFLETVCLFSLLAQCWKPKSCMWESVRITAEKKEMEDEHRVKAVSVKRSVQPGVAQWGHQSVKLGAFIRSFDGTCGFALYLVIEFCNVTNCKSNSVFMLLSISSYYGNKYSGNALFYRFISQVFLGKKFDKKGNRDNILCLSLLTCIEQLLIFTGTAKS